ncbi:MAG: DNA primase [Alistipes sp.]|nr:DNA primase [Alistipes sp.]
MIDQETVDRIYAAADIVEIISEYVSLKRKGVNYQACCPFHNEKTPSFVVSPSKGLYKCFGCGKGGNAVTFVMEQENTTYPEALKIVARKYGIEVKEKELTEEDIRRNDNRESMFTLNAWASDYFANYLHQSEEGMSVGMTYFRGQRGFSDATIKKFGLGMCPAKGDKMSKDALEAGYKEEFLLSTGLSIKRESDGRIYDRFRERVMFPVHNISGRIVAFGGRTLRTDKSVAKYQNSPESDIYSKKNELYGLFFAKKAIQQQDFAIMVEGYTDVISMHQSGVENVVASSGTSLTTEQIRLLGRFTKNITVIYDSDAAGIHASFRGIDMILKEGMNVRTVLLPEGDDPDSFARSHNASEVQAYISEREENFITFKAKLLLSDAANDPIKRSSVVSDIVQSIACIPDNIQRTMFVKECARLMDIDENLLLGEVSQKRIAQFGDKEAEDFVRRQRALARKEGGYRGGYGIPAPMVDEAAQKFGNIPIGSSVESLEMEIMNYLIKYGTEFYNIRNDDGSISKQNVAESIVWALDSDSITFKNSTFDTIFKEYRKALENGRFPESTEFINHHIQEVCTAAIDIVTSDDRYIESTMWEQKEVHTSSTQEMLSIGVPKVISLYRLKQLSQRIAGLQAKLESEGLNEEQTFDIVKELQNCNKVKNKLSKEVNRNII